MLQTSQPKALDWYCQHTAATLYSVHRQFVCLMHIGAPRCSNERSWHTIFVTGAAPWEEGKFPRGSQPPALTRAAACRTKHAAHTHTHIHAYGTVNCVGAEHSLCFAVKAPTRSYLCTPAQCSPAVAKQNTLVTVSHHLGLCGIAFLDSQATSSNVVIASWPL